MNATLPPGYLWSDTYAVSSSDTAAAIASNKKVRTATGSNRQARARYALIQPLTNAIKWALGATPVTGAGNLGNLCPVNGTIILTDSGAIDEFKFVSAVSGSHASLQVTLGF